MRGFKGRSKRRRTESDDDVLPNSSKKRQPRIDSYYRPTKLQTPRDDRPAKPQTPRDYRPSNPSHQSYTVGWICALPLEGAAARAMLDECYDLLPIDPADINTYTLGKIGGKFVAIASLPIGQYGTINAAIVASHMRHTFRSMDLFLVVGVGGGVPIKDDVRLGDVVVGKKVVQYDFGKTGPDGDFQVTDSSFTPHGKLLSAVSNLKAYHKKLPSDIPTILSEMLQQYPNMTAFQRRDTLEDLLFESGYDHDTRSEDCRHCDRSRIVQRFARSDLNPVIHHGVVASGNQVIKHGKTRDLWAQKVGNLCFEMEAAGVGGDFSCLAIRGICDYSDTHKNDEWQEYAAASAAAYAKELLRVMAPDKIVDNFAAPITPSLSGDVSNLDVRQSLLNSLRFEFVTRESDVKLLALKETCKWLLEHPDYKHWLKPEEYTNHHGFFWIKGKPGAGKSTLMNFIKDHTETAAHSNAAIITFFFHARGRELEKSALGMHMSLLLQLLEKFPDLQDVLDDPRVLQLHSEDGGHTRWDIEILCKIFSAATERLGNRDLICFIDALDECDVNQVRDMLEFFEDLGERALDTASRIYVCFSSRHYPNISIKYGRQLTLEDEEHHKQDLDKYVRSKFRSGKLPEKVRSDIIEKAAGVFMWVVLVLPILDDDIERGDIHRVKDKLVDLPPGLDELFKTILEKDSEDMDRLLLCLQWLLYAKRPLSREEFYFAMLSGMNENPESIIGWNRELISKEAMNRFITTSSKGLAEVTRTKDAVVQFIHESVRDFLLKKRGLWEIWPKLNNDIHCLSHDRLKQCCYTYFQANLPKCRHPRRILSKEDSNERKKLREDMPQDFPFLAYASLYVFYHADSAAAELSQVEFLKEFPLKDWIYLNNLFQRYPKKHNYTANASLVYIFAEHNWARLIASLSPKERPIELRGEENHRYPLFAALTNGHRAALEALLQPKSGRLGEDDVTTCIRETKDIKFEKNTPMTYAMRNQSIALVKMLLQTGQIDVTEKFYANGKCLKQAVKHQNKAIFTLILQKLKEEEEQSNVNPNVGSCRTSLHWAAALGEEDLLETLLKESQVNVNQKNSFGQTPLFEAVIWDNDGCVKLLLETGKVDVNITDNDGETPLFWAVRWNLESITDLLLKTDHVDINLMNNEDLKDNGSHTPFSLAIKYSRVSAVKKLLQTGKVKLYTRSAHENTALLLAVTRGNETIVKLLLETKKFDINARNNWNQTSLQLAVSKGYKAIVKMLLDTGRVDFNVRVQSLNTLLSLAASKGHKAVSEILMGQNRRDGM